jgi:hypothetical protein
MSIIKYKMATLSTKSNTWNITFEVIKPKYNWEWKLPYGTNCAICRKSIMELSAEANDRTICAPVKGVCGHTFHKDCITSWLKNNRKCPICKRPWKIQQIKSINTDENKTFLNNIQNLLKGIPGDFRKEINEILNNLKDNEDSVEKKKIIEKMIAISTMQNSMNQSNEESITDNETIQTIISNAISNVEDENNDDDDDDDMPELESVDDDDDDMPELESVDSNEEMEEVN